MFRNVKKSLAAPRTLTDNAIKRYIWTLTIVNLKQLITYILRSALIIFTQCNYIKFSIPALFLKTNYIKISRYLEFIPNLIK